MKMSTQVTDQLFLGHSGFSVWANVNLFILEAPYNLIAMPFSSEIELIHSTSYLHVGNKMEITPLRAVVPFQHKYRIRVRVSRILRPRLYSRESYDGLHSVGWWKRRLDSRSHQMKTWYESQSGARTNIWHPPFLYKGRFPFIQSTEEWNGSAFQWINTTRPNFISNSTALISACWVWTLGKRTTEQGKKGSLKQETRWT